MCVYTFVCLCVCAYAYICVYMDVCLCACVCLYACMCVLVCVCTCVSVSVCECFLEVQKRIDLSAAQLFQFSVLSIILEKNPLRCKTKKGKH